MEAAEQQVRGPGRPAAASREDVRENTGWELRVAPDLQVTPAPTEQELTALRTLTSR